MGRIIGVDLGTTNSLAAVCDVDGSSIVPLISGDSHLPSAVAFDALEGLVIGREARLGSATRPDSTVMSFKRHMGTDAEFLFGGETWSPQALSAIVLKELKRAVEAKLQAPVDRAVISVPAYFNEVQRRATREAGEIAGLRVERLVSEPTAAALAYGIKDLGADESILVFDLGGGTFDVSVLEMFEGIFSVRAAGGDSKLGGDDFDAALCNLILNTAAEQLEGRSLAPAGEMLLRGVTEEAKFELTKELWADVAVDDLPLADGMTVNLKLQVTRSAFEEATQELVERCRRKLGQVLRESGLSRENVQQVLLVGGATRMPMIPAFLEEFFGRPPLETVDPMQAVALGAGIQAHMLEEDTSLGEVIITDVSPFTLGVATVGEHAGRTRSGIFSPLIHRNCSLPTKKTETYWTTHPGQDSVTIEVYQGDDPLVENNVFLDRYHLGGIPTDSEDSEGIDITFQYDIDGILHVSAVVQSTGRSAGVKIDASKIVSSGSQMIACRSRVEDFWEASRKKRRLRDMIKLLESRGRDAAVQAYLDKAKQALASGDDAQIERVTRELSAWTDGNSS